MLSNELIKKYNLSGPRYTSYPTALQLTHFDNANLLQQWQFSNSSELSLYLHIPFCHSLCYYCGCNKQVTKQTQKAEVYLSYLLREIQLRSAQLTGKPVTQIHFGGGTPIYLSDDQLQRIMDALSAAFTISPNAQIGIEIDPRQMPLERIESLTRAGFNRLSIGVQDFNQKVQEAVNRVQDESHIRVLVAQARAAGFSSVSLDLIYGLPHQSWQTYKDTIDKVIDIQPDRLSLFNYAHLPDKFAAQRKIKTEHLPSVEQRRQMFQKASDRLKSNGYQCIGMDHFALKNDELADAQRRGKLHRNFQGYTTHGHCDLLGLGVSSISQVNGLIAQNERDLKEYYRLIDTQGDALTKGYLLNKDDKVRAFVIKQLICHFELEFGSVETKFGIDFIDYFKAELQALQTMNQDGLVELYERKIVVTSAGRDLIRAICMQFDNHIPKSQKSAFSRIL